MLSERPQQAYRGHDELRTPEARTRWWERAWALLRSLCGPDEVAAFWGAYVGIALTLTTPTRFGLEWLEMALVAWGIGMMAVFIPLHLLVESRGLSTRESRVGNWPAALVLAAVFVTTTKMLLGGLAGG